MANFKEYLRLREAEGDETTSADDTTAETGPKTAEELWADVKSDAKKYASSAKFVAKEGPKGFEVYTELNNQRKKYATMPQAEFEKSFERVRPSDNPDVEGFSVYRSTDTVMAAPYSGDPETVTVDGAKTTIKSGDYVTQSVVGDKTTYGVEKSAFFKSAYTKV